MKLDDEAASRRAMKPLMERLRLDAKGVAEAIFRTVNANMANKITEVSTKRGYDIRDTVMIAGGGGGPIHAGFIADSLGIRKVVVPPVAALYSAFGMFAMDIGQDYARSFVSRVATADIEALNRVYAGMEAEAHASFRAHGVDPKDVVLKRTADLRYVGQFHEVEIDIAERQNHPRDGSKRRRRLRPQARRTVHLRHAMEGGGDPDAPAEGVDAQRAVQLPQVEKGGANATARSSGAAPAGSTGSDVDTPVYDGEKVLAGNVITGPAIIEETTTTVVIPAAMSARWTSTRTTS